jgi:hypothetical protein
VDVTAGSLQTSSHSPKQSHTKRKRLQNSECASRLSVVIDILFRDDLFLVGAKVYLKIEYVSLWVYTVIL